MTSLMLLWSLKNRQNGFLDFSLRLDGANEMLLNIGNSWSSDIFRHSCNAVSWREIWAEIVVLSAYSYLTSVGCTTPHVSLKLEYRIIALVVVRNIFSEKSQDEPTNFCTTLLRDLSLLSVITKCLRYVRLLFRNTSRYFGVLSCSIFLPFSVEFNCRLTWWLFEWKTHDTVFPKVIGLGL